LLLKVVDSRSRRSARSRRVIAEPRRTPPRRLTTAWTKCSICLFLLARYPSVCLSGRDTPFDRSRNKGGWTQPAAPAGRPGVREGPSRSTGAVASLVPLPRRVNHTRSDEVGTYRRKEQFSDLTRGGGSQRSARSPPARSGTVPPCGRLGTGMPDVAHQVPRHGGGICVFW